MFKHDFVYSIYEDFIDIDKQIKNKIKKIKVTKFDENRNNFNSKNKMNPLLLDSVNTYLKKTFDNLKLKLENCWVQQYKKYEYH